MSDIITQLGDLTPEELAKVGNLINKLASKEEDKPEKKKRKPRKPKTNKSQQKRVRDEDVQRIEIQHSPGRKKSRKTIQSEHEAPVSRKRKGKGRSTQGSPRRGGKDGNGKQARTEAVQLGNTNKFFEMNGTHNKYKADSKTDAMLWEGRQIEKRRDEVEFVEVMCTKCEYYFDVHPGQVVTDRDTHEVIFNCNDCGKIPTEL